MAERRGAAPAGPRQSDDALQKTRQQNAALLAEKTAKNQAKWPTIVFFGAVSSRSGHRSVGHHSPRGRRRSETSSAAAARKMSVYVWSAFLAGTRFRAKIAPWVARFGRDPPSHHGVRARGLVAEIGAPEAAQRPARQLSQPGRSWGPPHRLRPALRRAG